MVEILDILALVQEFITEKNASKKWVAGVDTVQYAGPFFDHQEYTAAIGSLLSGWLVLGKDAQKFEHKFPTYFGKKFGVLTNSGSSSNLIQMNALQSKDLWNLPKGTKVVTPIAGFPTTVNPIFQTGFVPIFVDIELDSLNLDLNNLEQVLDNNPDCKVITFAHVLGNPPNMDKLMSIIKDRNLILLEDCCDALGSTYDNMPLGSFGELASCSFYPAHHITGGEGGFVACNTIDQERVVRSFREWGRGCYCIGQKANLLKNGTCGCRFNNWIPAFPDEIFDHKYVYNEIGYNLKPIELQASMLLAQMNKIDVITAKRKSNHAALCNIFRKYEEFFHIPSATLKSDPSWFAFAVTIRNGAPFTRTDITGYLEQAKIQTRPYFAGNILLQPAYTDYITDVNKIKNDYPISTKVMIDTFFLGTSPVITDKQIEYIGEQLELFMKQYTR